MEHPEEGATRMPGFPWDFGDTPPSYLRPALKLGQHTNEILRVIGMSDDEIS